MLRIPKMRVSPAVFRMVNTAKSAALRLKFFLTTSPVVSQGSGRRVLVTPSECLNFETNPGFGTRKVRKLRPLPSVPILTQGTR